MTDLHVDARLSDLEQRIDRWLAEFAADNPMIAALDRGTSDDTSFGQRTLRYETYVLPAPPEHGPEVMELLLRRNDQLTGVHFSIGLEDAIYLRGEIPDSAVTADELDRILGTLYTTVEANFQALVRLAFASRFDD